MDAVEFGRYRLLVLIGEGGMGQVFKARDTAIGRDVAIKVLPSELATEPGYRERFRREAHTAAQLTEPHVIPIFDTGEIDGRLYLVMPVIDGIDVASVLRRDGPMSPQLAVRVIEQLASALDAAHAHGLVHRDVKPSNALLTGTTGREFVYLIDFGIAHDSTATKLTKTGSVLGTLAYMAPERFTTGKADARADIYALACVLHECLTGSQPFPGDSMEQQIAGHLTLQPPRPSVQRPGVPAAFDDVIARGMSKDPDQRYRTALDLVAAAQQALTEPSRADSLPPAPIQAAPQPMTWQPADPTGAPTQLRTAGPPAAPPYPPAAPPSRRNGLILPIAAAAVFIVAIVAVVGYFAFGRTPTTASKTVSTTPSAATPSGATQPSAPSAPLGVPPLPSFTPSADLGANCQYPSSAQPANKPVNPPRTGKVPTDPAQVSVSVVTDQGNIGLLLANAKSPCTVNSFVSLAQQGFFDNTQCHRLTTSPTLSVLQCGDPTGDGTGGPGYQFANEYPSDQYQPGDPALHQPVVYPRGTLAMANAGPGTNGSQFFLVYKDSELPPEYTVFGTIQQNGLITLDKIAAAGVAGGGEDGTPATEVTIKSVRLD